MGSGLAESRKRLHARTRTHLKPRFLPSATRPLAKFSAVPVCDAKKMSSCGFEASSSSTLGAAVAGAAEACGASLTGRTLADDGFDEDINHQAATAAMHTIAASAATTSISDVAPAKSGFLAPVSDLNAKLLDRAAIDTARCVTSPFYSLSALLASSFLQRNPASLCGFAVLSGTANFLPSSSHLVL